MPILLAPVEALGGLGLQGHLTLMGGPLAPFCFTVVVFDSIVLLSLD